VSPQGGLTFISRQAARPGFQPFAGKRELHFHIKPNPNATDPNDTSTPVGQVPAWSCVGTPMHDWLIDRLFSCLPELIALTTD
jgi:hypothetical protein